MSGAPLTFLTAALDAAQRDAEAATAGPWYVHEYEPGIDVCGFEASIGAYRDDDEGNVVGHGYEGGGVERLADARFIAGNSPDVVLRRIAADRKTLEAHRAVECKEFACDCDDCCAACRWTESQERGTEPTSGYPDPHIYPCPTVRNMAEGWGWTEGATQ